MPPFLVRQASQSDVEALVPLFDAYRQFYGQPGDPAGARDFLSERLARMQSAVIVAEVDACLAGFAQLYHGFSSVSMARTFVLNDLFVAEGNRRKGIGTLLLGAALEFGRSAGAIRISLSTAVNNRPAQALYEALGWSRDERFYVYNFGLQA